MGHRNAVHAKGNGSFGEHRSANGFIFSEVVRVSKGPWENETFGHQSFMRPGTSQPEEVGVEQSGATIGMANGKQTPNSAEKEEVRILEERNNSSYRNASRRDQYHDIGFHPIIHSTIGTTNDKQTPNGAKKLHFGETS